MSQVAVGDIKATSEGKISKVRLILATHAPAAAAMPGSARARARSYACHSGLSAAAHPARAYPRRHSCTCVSRNSRRRCAWPSWRCVRRVREPTPRMQHRMQHRKMREVESPRGGLKKSVGITRRALAAAAHAWERLQRTRAAARGSAPGPYFRKAGCSVAALPWLQHLAAPTRRLRNARGSRRRGGARAGTPDVLAPAARARTGGTRGGRQGRDARRVRGLLPAVHAARRAAAPRCWRRAAR